jgi:hypothetical protein
MPNPESKRAAQEQDPWEPQQRDTGHTFTSLNVCCLGFSVDTPICYEIAQRMKDRPIDKLIQDQCRIKSEWKYFKQVCARREGPTIMIVMSGGMVNCSIDRYFTFEDVCVPNITFVALGIHAHFFSMSDSDQRHDDSPESNDRQGVKQGVP